MRIKKVFIKNFKGIEDNKIIDFSNKTSIMIGPNGFGKTTVFDVLELCLTGKINRTFEKKNVTKDNKDYQKPFYQNTIGKDVVIKVWLEKKIGNVIEDLIIVKFLSKDNDGKYNGKGRKNKPCDFNLLSTYKELNDDFDKEEFIPNEENRINDEDIDNFFDFDITKFSVEKIYKLFNYLQQEDTTYFLKKSENDRKDTLAFLFKTSEEEEKLDVINDYYLKLNKVKEKLNKKIENIRNHEIINKKEYNQLFTNGNYNFDKKDVFSKCDLSICITNKELYIEELNKLDRFIKIFSVEEYIKKTKIEELTKSISNRNLIDFYVLQKLLEKSKYENILNERQLLNDTKKIQAYILQNFIDKYEDLERLNTNYDEYKKFLNIMNYNDQLIKIKPFIYEFIPNKNNEYFNLIRDRKHFLETTNEIEKSVSEIIRLRSMLKGELEEHKSIFDEKCPYCGIPWKTYENLMNGFIEREKELKEICNNQIVKLEECNMKLKDEFIDPIKKQMRKYIENNDKVDCKILSIIRNQQYTTYDFTDIKNNNTNRNLIWEKLDTYNKLEETVSELEENIEKNLDVNKELYNKINYLSNISFAIEVEKLEKNCLENELDRFVISNNNKNQLTLDDLESNSKLLKEFLENTKGKYSYDFGKADDSENIYGTYFNYKNDELIKLDQQSIELKKDYIENEFLQKQNSLVTIYEQRYNEIDNIITRMSQLKNNYEISIKKYKKDMVNKIKIPFYIYTSKILQNYQQGMGVFLVTKENSDSIRFLTDSSSDHDAMHHLSSGQLAVVSLAFCLAINKTYNISKNLKILLIDDPIQEMDALNIHSFIELIRHEFIEDYQLIFSTHNDSNALYIKYKFEKIINNSVKMINVQDEFFN